MLLYLRREGENTVQTQHDMILGLLLQNQLSAELSTLKNPGSTIYQTVLTDLFVCFFKKATVLLDSNSETKATQTNKLSKEICQEAYLVFFGPSQ